jgi:serine/threonine-protein kinase HipA
MGALRFRVDGPFLADRNELAAPPWTSLRALEFASHQIQQDGAEDQDEYATWLRMLTAPGSSLGGARPKAGVVDERGHLWIAKFPGRSDERDVGAWEAVTQELATRAGIDVPEVRCMQLNSGGHTFLSKRFDRAQCGSRLHAASAMTLLERLDGEGSAEGASYLELADVLIARGSHTDRDLRQLWRRIVFYVLVSNTDDHLRNHAFMLNRNGWELAPAYDMNPDPMGEGLSLNITEGSNEQDLDLVLSAAGLFRVNLRDAKSILHEVIAAVCTWREVAEGAGLGSAALREVERSFRLAEG